MVEGYKYHKAITTGENHIIFDMVFADQANRIAGTLFPSGQVSDDNLYKIALQFDNFSLWFLAGIDYTDPENLVCTYFQILNYTSLTPPSWDSITTGIKIVTSSGNGVLEVKDSNTTSSPAIRIGCNNNTVVSTVDAIGNAVLSGGVPLSPNTIQGIYSETSVICGGQGNAIDGTQNPIDTASNSVICGGDGNTVYDNLSFIGSGQNNQIIGAGPSYRNTIICGRDNTIQSNSSGCTIIGEYNTISGSDNAVVIGNNGTISSGGGGSLALTDNSATHVTIATSNFMKALFSNGISLISTQGIVIGPNTSQSQTPTAQLDINSNTIRIRTDKTPASAAATGNKGEICYDTNYIYVCVATNTWKRAALSTW